MTTPTTFTRVALASLLLLGTSTIASRAADDRPAPATAAQAESLPIVGTWRVAEDTPTPLPRRTLDEHVSPRVVVRDTAKAIEIDWTFGSTTVTHSYAKDGSEETVTHQGEQGAVTSRHSGTWKDGRFTIKDASDALGPAGLAVTTVATIILRRSGEDLVLERRVSQPFPLDVTTRYRRDGAAPRPTEPAPPPPPTKDPPKPASPTEVVKGSVAQLAWLAGHWTGSTPTSTPSGKGSATLEEHWTKPAGGAMLATTRTISGDRMTEFEFLRVVERAGSLVFIAQPGGREPTEFRLIEITESSFTVENVDNDFPQRVTYYLGEEPDTLKAEISDVSGAKVMRFAYRRER